jgi:hypothetical protein
MFNDDGHLDGTTTDDTKPLRCAIAALLLQSTSPDGSTFPRRPPTNFESWNSCKPGSMKLLGKGWSGVGVWRKGCSSSHYIPTHMVAISSGLREECVRALEAAVQFKHGMLGLLLVLATIILVVKE